MKYHIIYLLLCCVGICFTEDVGSVKKSPKSINGTKTPLEIYQNLFKLKRKEQILMIEKVILMEDVEKQDKMIGIMLIGIIETMAKGRKILEDAQYKPGDPFPEKTDVKDGYSMVLESTAILTDVVVRFPSISERKFKTFKLKDWIETVQWAKNISEKSGVFIKKHEQILKSLGQELKLDDIDPNYKNPFKNQPKIIQKTSEERKLLYEEKKRKEKMAAKKKKKAAPKLTKSEL